jgi:hypothetical protein
MKPLHELRDDELAELARLGQTLRDAPAPLLHQALRLWSGSPLAQGGVWQAAARRVLAVLSFDSWATSPLAAGMRSAPAPFTAEPARHLLFSAQGRDLDLRVLPQGQGFAVSGQVLGPDLGGQVRLVAEGGAGETAERVTELDELGGFHIDNLARGRYLLTLRAGEDEVVLPTIEIGPRDGPGPHL